MFVIEEAEDLRDESQNALLKTLEEPAAFTHLILICSEPELLAETILSRCAPSSSDRWRQTQSRRSSGPARREHRVEAERRGRRARQTAAGRTGEAIRATARRPRALRSPRMVRRRGGSCSTPRPRPVRRRVRGGATPARRPRPCSGPAVPERLTREAAEQVKRTERRARTEALDLGLALCCAWYRDLAAVATGADFVVLERRPPGPARRGCRGASPPARTALEWVLDTRRRLRVNVSEELALEALWLRLSAALDS